MRKTKPPARDEAVRKGRLDWRWDRLVAAAMLLLWNVLSGFGGCCPIAGSSTADQTYYEVHVGSGEPRWPWGPGLTWGAVLPRASDPPIRQLWVVLPEGHVPTEPMLELTRDGEPIDLPFREVRDLRPPPHGCGRFHAQLYELDRLAPGTYTIVHRRATAPAGFTLENPRVVWTVTDGDERVQTLLVVPGAADAGVGHDAP